MEKTSAAAPSGGLAPTGPQESGDVNIRKTSSSGARRFKDREERKAEKKGEKETRVPDESPFFRGQLGKKRQAGAIDPEVERPLDKAARVSPRGSVKE